MSVNILKIANAMFKNKNEWNTITKEEKEESFFIFNRYFSKIYPSRCNLLNYKTIDKEGAMDLWHHFMYNKSYPKVFWSKSDTRKEKNEYTDSEYNYFLVNLQLKKEELDILIREHNDIFMEELEYIRSIEKSNKKSK